MANEVPSSSHRSAVLEHACGQRLVNGAGGSVKCGVLSATARGGAILRKQGEIHQGHPEWRNGGNAVLRPC